MVETPEQAEVEDDASTDASTETISSRKALELLLKQTRASVRVATYVEVTMWSAAAALAYIFTAFSLALMMPKYAEAVVEYTAYGGALIFVGAITWILFALWQTYPSLYDIAARLQSSTPEFRSDIVAALQFSEPDANLSHMSEELALLHVERTARMLVEAKKQVGQLSDLLPQRTYAPPLIAMLAGLSLCYGIYVLRTDDVERLAASLWEEVKPSAQTQKAARSIVGEIDLHYAYPPYSNRAPTYEGFTTGHIKALVGTEVTIKTYPLVEARAFEIVWRTGEDERTIELESSDERRLETTINLTKTGTYTFRAIAADGSILEDPLNRTIEVEPDKTPEIVITSHQGEIEVSPGDQLTIEFTVADDFGIETVNTSSHFAQDDQNATRTALDLPSLINIPRSIDGSTVFDLAPLNLQPKDVVIFSIEATDNNSMTGPSIGKSSPIVLRVTSPADKHQRLIRAQQEVFDSLIGVLGSFLESPIGEREVERNKDVQRVRSFAADTFKPKFDKLAQAYDEEAIVLQVMQSLSKELEDDPLLLKRDFQTFKGIYERLYRTHRDGVEVLSRVKPKIGDGRIKKRDAQKVADTASKHEHLLEGIVLALEDVLKQQKVDAIEDTAKEIRDIRDRIKELLEKYRETGDPEVKKAIQREVQRLRQRMAELLKRMQSQVQNLPQEHLNMDALEQAAMESKSTDINSDLQSIEEMLQNDDIDGALAALDRMSENLDQLTQEIGQQSGGPESSGLSALDQELNELMNKLNDIESTQRGLEQETREIQLKAERERDDEVKDLLNKGLGEVEKLAKQQAEQLKKMQNRKLPRHDARSVEGAMQRLEQLQNAVKQRDVEQALERARELEQDLKSMDFSLELSERYARDKNAVRKDIRASRKDLKSIVPRSKQITKQLKEIIEEASMKQSSNDPKVGELKQRQSEIEKRTGELQKEIKGSAQRFPMLDGEMKESIDRAKNDMSSSKKGLKKSRVQRSLDFQRSALENLQKVKQSMKNALEKERQGDRKKSDEKVAIPKKDSRDALDIRDEVQKRMKDERLENYDSEIERYYKSLTE